MRSLCLAVISAVVLMGCQRPEGDVSKLTIELPAGLNDSQKVGAFAAWPTGKKFCYGVNVTGDGIETETDACSPALGTRIGFTDQSSVSLEVRKGTGRQVDVYVYVAAVSEACPVLGKSPDIDRRKIYLVGSKSRVDMSKDETKLDLFVTYPGDNAHIAAQLSMPAVCLAGGSTPMGSGARLSLGVGHFKDSNYEMNVRVNAVKALQ